MRWHAEYLLPAPDAAESEGGELAYIEQLWQKATARFFSFLSLSLVPTYSGWSSIYGATSCILQMTEMQNYFLGITIDYASSRLVHSKLLHKHVLEYSREQFCP